MQDARFCGMLTAVTVSAAFTVIDFTTLQCSYAVPLPFTAAGRQPYFYVYAPVASGFQWQYLPLTPHYRMLHLRETF